MSFPLVCDSSTAGVWRVEVAVPSLTGKSLQSGNSPGNSPVGLGDGSCSMECGMMLTSSRERGSRKNL